VILAGVIAGFALPQWWAANRTGEEALQPSLARELAAYPGLPARGASSGDVTIVFFTDHRCGVCRQTERALDEVLAQDSGVRLVYRFWPILGPESEKRARLALAAQGRGDFLPVHRALLRAAPGGAPAPASPAVEAMLGDTARQALALRLRGTPGLVIGPFLVRGGLQAGQIRRLVAEAREGAA
jgi:protein-disulfide isomerase